MSEPRASPRLWLAIPLRIAAGTVMALATIHAAAWLATPRGLGFNPHPWYLAAPEELRSLMQALGLPTTNLGVVSTFFLFLPAYIVVAGTCWWLAKRCRSPDVGHRDRS